MLPASGNLDRACVLRALQISSGRRHPRMNAVAAAARWTAQPEVLERRADLMRWQHGTARLDQLSARYLE